MRTFLLALAACFAAVAAHAQNKPPAIVIQHVTVIDVRAGKPIADQTVVVENGRITTVATGMSVKMPAGTKAVDGTGKFLIPGLWDMHVHAAWPGLDALFAPPARHVVVDRLLAADVNNLTPLAALQLLAELTEQAKQ